MGKIEGNGHGPLSNGDVEKLLNTLADEWLRKRIRRPLTEKEKEAARASLAAAFAEREKHDLEMIVECFGVPAYNRVYGSVIIDKVIGKQLHEGFNFFFSNDYSPTLVKEITGSTKGNEIQVEVNIEEEEMRLIFQTANPEIGNLEIGYGFVSKEGKIAKGGRAAMARIERQNQPPLWQAEVNLGSILSLPRKWGVNLLTESNCLIFAPLSSQTPNQLR